MNMCGGRWIGLCVLLLSAGEAGAQGTELKRIATTVTYLTAAGIYVGAGRTVGLAVGDTLGVERGPTSIGRAVVSAVSSSSSMAAMVGTGSSPAVGDSVVIWKRVPIKTESRPVVPPTGRPVLTRTGPTNEDNLVTGRLGLQYSGIGRLGHAPDFSQPGVVGRLDIARLFGSNLVFRFYGRVMGDMTANFARYGNGDRWRTRFYELSLSSDEQRFGFGLGRIVPRYAGGLGTVDGGELYGKLGVVTAGVIGGAQANFVTSGLDPDHQKLAAFVNVGWGRDVWSRSDITLAYGQQLFKGKLDRNFTYLQASARFGPEFFLFGSSEFDFHKVVGTEVVSRFHMTNSFVTVTYSPAFRWLTVNAGYDATRPVPLLESEKTFLDTLMDRSLHQGLRGSLSFQLPGRLVLTTTGTYRMATRTISHANSASVGLRASDVLGSGFGLGAQYGDAKSPYADGKDLVLDLDRWITDWLTAAVRLDRYDYQLFTQSDRHRMTTLSINASGRISSAWYAALSGDRIWEDAIITHRLYIEIGVRF